MSSRCRRVAGAGIAFAACIALAFWMAGDGVPSKEEFEEVGFRVKLKDQPSWLDQTEFLKKLTKRSPSIVSLFRRSTDEPLTDQQIEFLVSLPSVERLSLPSAGLTDKQLRRIIHCHRYVVHLFVDGNLLTDEILPDIAALPELLSLSIDCENVSLAMLGKYADQVNKPDLVTPTAGTRLRARFLDASDDDVSGFPGMFEEHPWTHLYKGAIARGLPGNAFELQKALSESDAIEPLEMRSARFTPRYQHATTGKLVKGVVGIDFDSTDKRFPSFRSLTDDEFEALAAIRTVWLFEITGVDPVQKLPATFQVESFGSSLRTPEIRAWLSEQTGLKYQRYWDVVGEEDSFSDIDLTGQTTFSFDADRHAGHYLKNSRRMTFDENTPAYVHSMSGEFLNSIVGAGEVTRLVVRGRLPVGNDLDPAFVDFSQFQSLTDVTLIQLALDDASLKTLASLPGLKKVMLGDLPHVSADGLDAVKESLGETKPVLGERLMAL